MAGDSGAAKAFGLIGLGVVLGVAASLMRGGLPAEPCMPCESIKVNPVEAVACFWVRIDHGAVQVTRQTTDCPESSPGNVEVYSGRIESQ